MTTGTSTGLVLAGGGVAGIAWELGVLHGIALADADLGAQVLAADLVVGTSAGAAVGAQVTSGVPLTDLVAAQLGEEHGELEVDVDLEELITALRSATAGAATEADRRRAIGAVALAAATVAEGPRRAAVASRLPVHTWPERRLLITAVEVGSGDLVVLDATAGAPLVDAVTASCAVPGVWPPATIGGRRYVDGGVRSSVNADLAAGCDRVLVVSPTAPDAELPFGDLARELATLTPARVHVVHADEASLAAYGTNPLSPATRGGSVRAGIEVGRREAAAVRAAWSGQSMSR